MFTATQKAAIKADIIANTDLNSIINNEDGAFAIAFLYNLPASPDFLVWNTNAAVKDIFDAITWANYTPTDAADNTATQTNRLLAVQTKQMNLQNMLQGRDSIDAGKANIRTGLRDAVIALPSGVGGASVSAGGASGVTVLTACTRKSTRLEKLLSTGSAQTGTVTANLPGWEGMTNYQEIFDARNS